MIYYDVDAAEMEYKHNVQCIHRQIQCLTRRMSRRGRPSDDDLVEMVILHGQLKDGKLYPVETIVEAVPFEIKPEVKRYNRRRGKSPNSHKTDYPWIERRLKERL